jgi:IS30 family transposase
MRERKLPVGEIARQLGRHRSTIYRELKRNTFRDQQFPEYSGYFGTIADDISKERRRRFRKLTRHPELRELVIERLKAAVWLPTVSVSSAFAPRRSIASSIARKTIRLALTNTCLNGDADGGLADRVSPVTA